MNATMTEEKKPKRGRPKGAEETKALQMRVTISLYEALSKLAKKHRRTRNKELMVALESHLQAFDALPPEEEDKREG